MNLRTLGLLSLPALFCAAAPALTMADLSALAKQSAWKELLERAEEIAPASRDEAWRGAVGQAAAGVVKKSDDALALADQLLGRFEFLGESKAFGAAVRKPVLDSAAKCLGGRGAACLEPLTRVARSLSEPTFALDAARVARRNLFHYLAAPLFALAVEKGAPKACEDDDLRRAVLAALAAPADEPYVASAKALVEGTCFPTLRESVEAELSTAAPDSYVAQNTCALMKAKGALAKLKSNPCKDR